MFLQTLVLCTKDKEGHLESRFLTALPAVLLKRSDGVFVLGGGAQSSTLEKPNSLSTGGWSSMRGTTSQDQNKQFIYLKDTGTFRD